MAKTHLSKPAPAVEIDLMSSTVNLGSFMYSRTFLTCTGSCLEVVLEDERQAIRPGAECESGLSMILWLTCLACSGDVQQHLPKMFSTLQLATAAGIGECAVIQDFQGSEAGKRSPAHKELMPAFLRGSLCQTPQDPSRIQCLPS